MFVLSFIDATYYPYKGGNSMKRILLPLAAMILFSLCSTTAMAVTKAELFSLTPYIGGYVFDGVQHLKSRPEVGIRAGYNFTDALGLEGVLGYVSTKGTESGKSSSVYNYHLDGIYSFTPEARLVPFVALGLGGISLNGQEKNSGTVDFSSLTVNYGAGVNYFLDDYLAVRGDVRHIFYHDNHYQPASDSKISNNYEYTVGLNYYFGKKMVSVKPVEPAKPVVGDADNDGVPDTLDKCPNTPAGVKVDGDGCPVDSDRDGIADYLDKCPDTPPGVKVDQSGCPVDTDKDGVADYLDKCPDTPAGVKVDGTGCPLDTDRDGVPDHLDKCPNTPLGAKVDADGCPADTDKDGVPDYLDKCPNTAAGIKVQEDGCPYPAGKPCQTTTLDVQFDTNKADIKPQYHAELQKLGEFLSKYSRASLLIEGHTDNVGKAKYNLKLSERRAEAVKKHITTTYGIAPDRITTKAYGLTKPVASNKTEAGRAKNRRIEALMSCGSE
jgi:OOP family OmpA-OmpF porin